WLPAPGACGAPPRCVRTSTVRGCRRTIRRAPPSLQAPGRDDLGRPRRDTQRGSRRPELVAAAPGVASPRANSGQSGKASTSEPPFSRDCPEISHIDREKTAGQRVGFVNVLVAGCLDL